MILGQYVTLRASPAVLSMRLQTVKFIVEKSKCAGLAQEIGFSAPNSCSLPWLIKGTTQLCNKLLLLLLRVVGNPWLRHSSHPERSVKLYCLLGCFMFLFFLFLFCLSSFFV
jgi:hypothetical protein